MEAAVFGAPARDPHGRAPAARAGPGRGADRRACRRCLRRRPLYLSRHQPVCFLPAGRRARDRRHGREARPRHRRARTSARRSSSSRSSVAAIAIPAGSANRTAAPISRSSASTATAASPTMSLRRSTASIRSPTGLSPMKASFAEPVAIGVQACRRGAVSGDDTVLILGAGPIGLALVEVARARGAKVFVTDIDAARLATAAELGGTPLAAGEGLLDAVHASHRRRRHAGGHRGDRQSRRRWNRPSILSPPAAASSSSGWSRRGRWSPSPVSISRARR